jgi:hypothetical protein
MKPIKQNSWRRTSQSEIRKIAAAGLRFDSGSSSSPLNSTAEPPSLKIEEKPILCVYFDLN